MGVDLDDFFDEPEALVPDMVLDTRPLPKPVLSEKAGAMARLRSLEEKIYTSAVEIVEAAQAFKDIDPADENPPLAWIEELGFDEAVKKHRVARAAWMSAKNAPIGLQMAQRTILGVQKSRSADNVARALGMVVEFHIDPMANYPVKKVEK